MYGSEQEREEWKVHPRRRFGAVVFWDVESYLGPEILLNGNVHLVYPYEC